ncbi:hypothetical protein H2O64_03235 [Kordia sp. YSTF-M3]|uniref:Uncharacterized protein n=1 Tax=Kordia aestuariivivens TaxID=2759037 RepID=A0ABR7Q5K8_9FLAO|nr:hypothetical protein [Kordia aestuariivivens]MBC8753666.1 hypothetical protein [Kordia aestuariivivens]
MNNITIDVLFRSKFSNSALIFIFILKRVSLMLALWLSMLHTQISYAQEKNVYDVQNLKLDETTADGIISFQKIVPHLMGIPKLRRHVYENQELYPMEQKAIETSRDKKHEAHKRWERYMRKLPVYVYVVRDVQNYIQVTTEISNRFTVCQKFNDNLTVNIENKNEYPISAEIEFDAGNLVNFPKSGEEIKITFNKNQKITFNYIGNGRATFSLPAKSKVSATIPVVYTCDGKNGKTNKTENNQILINHKINLVGYIYNSEKKELYRITSFPVTTSSIKLAYL